MRTGSNIHAYCTVRLIKDLRFEISYLLHFCQHKDWRVECKILIWDLPVTTKWTRFWKFVAAKFADFGEDQKSVHDGRRRWLGHWRWERLLPVLSDVQHGEPSVTFFGVEIKTAQVSLKVELRQRSSPVAARQHLEVSSNSRQYGRQLQLSTDNRQTTRLKISNESIKTFTC